jgi:hypothetical protein
MSLEADQDFSNAIARSGVGSWVHPAGLAGARDLPWRRIAKFGIVTATTQVPVRPAWLGT